MKPIIAISVYHRFYELGQNLEVIRQRLSEFAEKPIVVVIWARPQRSREWFMQQLVDRGLIDYLMYRPELPDEPKQATTYSESRNIDIARLFVKARFGDDTYIVYQAADIRPQPGVYKLIEQEIASHNVCLWHWSGIARDSYHTNFFTIRTSETEYFPPITPPNCADVLEAAWGQVIPRAKLYVTHNANERHFVNRHETECNCVPPRESVYLFIKGKRKSILERFLEWLRY